MMKKLLLAILVILFVLPLGALAEEYGWSDGKYNLEGTGLVLVLPEGVTPVEPSDGEVVHATYGEIGSSATGYKNISVSVIESGDVDQIIAENLADSTQMFLDTIGEENVYDDAILFLFAGSKSPLAAYIASDNIVIEIEDEPIHIDDIKTGVSYLWKRIYFLHSETYANGDIFYMLEAYVDCSVPNDTWYWWILEENGADLKMPETQSSSKIYKIGYTFQLSEEEQNTYGRSNVLAKNMLYDLFEFENADLVLSIAEDFKPIIIEELQK